MEMGEKEEFTRIPADIEKVPDQREAKERKEDVRGGPPVRALVFLP